MTAPEAEPIAADPAPAASPRRTPRCLPQSPISRPHPLGAARSPHIGCALSGLSDSSAQAVADLLPAMVCGEESAVLAFSNELRRAPEDLFDHSRQALGLIAAEEEVHEEILRSLADRLPLPQHDAHIRRLARRFFLTLRTDDIGVHFSRIAWLDSGVCIILSSLLRPGSPVSSAPALTAAVSTIIAEEARHVAFSRRYAAHLAVRPADLRESFMLVRAGLVDLLQPCAPAFERLGADPDRLFARLKQASLPGIPS